MSDIFIGSVIVAVSIGVMFGPLYGFIFFGSMCILTGVCSLILKDDK